jgi:hypothetical protein
MASTFRPRVIKWDDWREVAFVAFAGVCLLALVAFVSRLAFEIATTDSEQIVSGPVTLSPQWTEFVPGKPLRQAKQFQEIVLDVDPSEGLVADNLHIDRMQLSNGVVLHPQIQLIDSQGNVFTADVNRYPVPSLYTNGIAGQFSRLPADGTIAKVRVRSDSPVRLSRIIWHCHRGK